MMELIGWLGAALFCFCGAPQAYASWNQGHSRGISAGFLFMWGAGEVLTLTYVLGSVGINLPLLCNYAFNLVFLSVIGYYKLWERP